MKLTEDQWNRWIDGQANDADLQDAQNDPEIADDHAFFSRLSSDLKASVPSEKEPPFADFFNSQLQKRLRDLDEDAAVAKSAPRWQVPAWLRLSWALPLAAAAVLILSLAQIGMFGKRAPQGSQIIYAYTPDESVKAEAKYNLEADAMVIRLDGVDDLPESFDLMLVGRERKSDPDTMLANHGSEETEPQDPTPEIQFTTSSPVY